jgi:hypothetical protein
MKIFFVVTIARQVEGEMISVKFEKAYTQASKADQYAQGLAKTTVETITVPGVGPVQFVCERGVHEIEVEE